MLFDDFIDRQSPQPTKVLGHDFQNAVFKRLDQSRGQEQKVVFKEVASWVRHPCGAIILCGGLGVGKTQLLSCASNALWAVGRFQTGARLKTLIDESAAIRSRHYAKSTFESIIHQFVHKAVLIDEIGVSAKIGKRVNEKTGAPEKYIIDTMENKEWEILNLFFDMATQFDTPMLMTTNLNEHLFRQFLGPRIADASQGRLKELGAVFLECKWQGYR